MVILGGMHTTSCWSTTTKATIFFGSMKQWFELINYVSISGDSNPQKKTSKPKTQLPDGHCNFIELINIDRNLFSILVLQPGDTM